MYIEQILAQHIVINYHVLAVAGKGQTQSCAVSNHSL